MIRDGTQDCRVVGIDGSTELWRLPLIQLSCKKWFGYFLGNIGQIWATFYSIDLVTLAADLLKLFKQHDQLTKVYKLD